MTTERLRLTAPTAADVDELDALHADPAVWQDFPSRRHTDRALTEARVQREVRSWADAGLSSWVVRARDAPSGPVRGLVGYRVHDGPAWNLGSRLGSGGGGVGGGDRRTRCSIGGRRRAAGGRLSARAQRRLSADGERAGLTLVWRGRDRGNPDAGAVRLVYADRPLAGPVLNAFTLAG